jgi:large subunit ribosomal protein L10
METTTAKHDNSEKLREELSSTSGFVLVEFAGLTVAAVADLRRKLRDAGCTYKVYKNTTIHYAVEGTKHAKAQSLLRGVTGLAYHLEDPGAPARVARDFAKDNEKFRIKGGIYEGSVLDERGVVNLAGMPGPRELKAQFLALLNTPAQMLLRVLNAPGQGLLNVLVAKKDKGD